MQCCCYKKKVVLPLVLLCLLTQTLFCTFAYYHSTSTSRLLGHLPNLYSRGSETLELEASQILEGAARKGDYETQLKVQKVTEALNFEQAVSVEVLERTGIPGQLRGAPFTINDRHNQTINPSRFTTSDWSGGSSRGSFCHEFLVRTFQKPIPVCANARNGAIQCFGSPFSNHMSSCIVENVVVSPRDLGRAMSDADHTKFKSSEPSISFLSDRGSECQNMTVVNLRKHVESGDYMWQIVDKMKQEKRKQSHVCDRWIDDDVLFFTAHRFHIYFRFLDYFNLHKILEDFKYVLSNDNVPLVIRISGSNDYHFADFDQQLFPEVNFETLDQLGSENVCFRKIILVPKSYASVLYQCKMPGLVRQKCDNCNGWGLSRTQIRSFRNRVLRACALDDGPRYNVNSSIVFVSRKQYLRNENDKANHFERIMDNEDDLLAELRWHFNSSVVQKVHFENLGICQQVEVVHNADFYLGVHGSGLVHLWWLRSGALVYELEPHYEIGNPTFRTLARLSGQMYKKSSIAGGWGKVHARIDSIVTNLEKFAAGRNVSEDKFVPKLGILQFPRLGVL